MRIANSAVCVEGNGLNLAQAAARVMVGKTLEEQGIMSEPVPTHVSVKGGGFSV